MSAKRKTTEELAVHCRLFQHREAADRLRWQEARIFELETLVDVKHRGERWMSICSAHYYHDSECSTCQVGEWCSFQQMDFDKHEFITDYPKWYERMNGVPPDAVALSIRAMYDKDTNEAG